MVQIWDNQPCEWRLSFIQQADKDNGGKALALSISASEAGGQCLMVGLGPQKEFTALLARRAVAHGIREAKKLSAPGLVVDISAIRGLLGEDALGVAVEAARLALYQQENWKKKEPAKDFLVYFDLSGIPDGEKCFAEGLALAEAVAFARELVNCPPNYLTPAILAEKAADAAKEVGLDVEILDEKAMQDLGMGSLLAVGNSSANPPRMITISYKGDPSSKEVLALVGKGVTFDTGGYNLKPSNAMAGMHGDMAGAAAVCAAVTAVAAQKFKLNVMAVMPAVENRISPSSLLPGDVVTSMSGRTIEVGNTDAEGRLILLDAMTYAIEKKGATRVIDIATLTGAVINMLGHTTAGLLTNNEELYALFMQAAACGGEQYWRLPSFSEYRKMIESPVADLHNMSNDGCGSITAGLFLENFAEGKPWIHLDIAGTAWADKPRNEYQIKGGTGAGVTALYHLCRLLAKGK